MPGAAFFASGGSPSPLEFPAQARDSGLDVVPVSEVEAAATAAGLPPDQVAAVSASYGAAQLDGLRLSLGGVVLFSLLGLVFTRNLPATSGALEESGRVEPESVPAPAG